MEMWRLILTPGGEQTMDAQQLPVLNGSCHSLGKPKINTRMKCFYSRDIHITPRVPDVVHPGDLRWSCRWRRGHSCLLMFTRMSLLSLMLAGTGTEFDQLHQSRI